MTITTPDGRSTRSRDADRGTAVPLSASPPPGQGPHTTCADPANSDVTTLLITRLGLLIPDELPFDEWVRAGEKLTGLMDSSAWCLGDWLAHGQERYRGRYQPVADRLGMDPQTLRNYAWLARKFDRHRRRPTLSMQHHAEVAGLTGPEQDVWLDRAVEGRWSRNALRRKLREARSTRTGGGTDRPAAGYLPRLRVDADELACWERAAREQETDLGSWVRQALRDAARTGTEPVVGG